MKKFSAPSSSSVVHPSAPASCDRRTVPVPAWKRGLDILGCLAALPLLALSTLFAAVLIRIASPGPIFFRQDRVGYRGRRFKLYKFRTMHVTADVTTHQTHFAELVRSNVPMHKLDTRGDRRLVPGGWLLRATGMDELPQIINVLRGEMSLVGPRPIVLGEVERYGRYIEKYYAVRPGITGLWQIGGRNNVSYRRRVALDVTYARNRSTLLNVRILIWTIPSVLMARGSY
jgi:exopolysaccharide production protein ExoY